MILNLSINKSMINKANPSLYGWKNAEMTGEELADHIHNGFAFSPGVLKPNASGRKPSIKDIKFAHILAIDIDNDIKSYNSITKSFSIEIYGVIEREESDNTACILYGIYFRTCSTTNILSNVIFL